MLIYYTRGNYPYDSYKIILIFNQSYNRNVNLKETTESECCTHCLCALSWPIKNDLKRNFCWKIQIEKHFYKTFWSQEIKSLPLMFVLGVILRNPSFTEEIFVKVQCVPLVILKETVVLHYSLHLYSVLHNCKCDLVIPTKAATWSYVSVCWVLNLRSNVSIFKCSNPQNLN